METIVHIGQPKTGTTSLQHSLRSNKEALRELGIFIPERLLHFNQSSHFLLNIYSLEPDRSSPMKDQLLQAHGEQALKQWVSQTPEAVAACYEQARKENCNKIIWSNEGLFLLNSKEEYARLINLFRPYSDQVTSVCCFRDQSSFINSFQGELEAQGIPIQTAPDSYSYLENDSWLLDYDRKKALLSSTFDQSIFLEYHPDDNTQPFLDAVNIPLTMHNTRLNTTPGKQKRWWPLKR